MSDKMGFIDTRRPRIIRLKGRTALEVVLTA